MGQNLTRLKSFTETSVMFCLIDYRWLLSVHAQDKIHKSVKSNAVYVLYAIPGKYLTLTLYALFLEKKYSMHCLFSVWNIIIPCIIENEKNGFVHLLVFT